MTEKAKLLLNGTVIAEMTLESVQEFHDKWDAAHPEIYEYRQRRKAAAEYVAGNYVTDNVSFTRFRSFPDVRP